MKIPYRRIMQAVLVLAAGTIVVFFLWTSRAHAVEGPPSSQERAGETVQRATAANAAPSLPTLDEISKTDDYEDNPLGDELRRVLSNDQQLATFKYYHNRPLLDEASKKRYREFLADPAVFANIEHDLLYPEETKVDRVGNIKRLMKIDYLREALGWEGNPMRDTLIALVSQMILADNFPPGMAMDMRLSLSGNKRELYELLYEIAPEQANALLQASKGTRLEKLIAYIDNSLQVRLQLEASLKNKVTP